MLKRFLRVWGAAAPLCSGAEARLILGIALTGTDPFPSRRGARFTTRRTPDSSLGSEQTHSAQQGPPTCFCTF